MSGKRAKAPLPGGSAAVCVLAGVGECVCLNQDLIPRNTKTTNHVNLIPKDINLIQSFPVKCLFFPNQFNFKLPHYLVSIRSPQVNPIF